MFASTPLVTYFLIQIRSFICKSNVTCCFRIFKFELYFSISNQALDHLQSFVSDADRKTEAAKKRLVETQEELSAEAATKVSVQ